MVAQVIDEFLVFDRYRVMVLDKDVLSPSCDQFKINGQLYRSVALHGGAAAIPFNYIAVKSTQSFQSATVELA